jgi:predicted PurR-regulated permease PerM
VPASNKNHQLLRSAARVKNGDNGVSIGSAKREHNPSHDASPINGGLSSSSSVKSQLNVLIFLGLVAFFYFTRSVVLPILLAAVGAMVLKPIMKWLSRAGIPKALGALLLLGFFLGGIGIGFVELSQPAMKWITDAPKDMAQLRQRADRFFPADKIEKAADALSQMPVGTTTNKIPSVQVNEHSGTGKAINWTAGLLAGIIETVVLLYMFLVLGDALLNQILDGKDYGKKREALSIGREVQETISNYLLTVTIINICLGAAVGAGLYFLGVPNAVLWGLMATIVNYIPYFGPIAGIVIVGIVSLLTIDTIPKSLIPATWYLVLHIAEADYITPVLLGRRFTISPVVVFISLLFGIWLWGVPGALLSAPILITLKVLCQRVPSFFAANRFL